MAKKPWDQDLIWYKCFLGKHFKVYLNAGKIIGHARVSAFSCYDAAKLLPNFDKRWYETAVNDLTIYDPRTRGEYELPANAKKVLRIILGPEPSDPEYAAWWRLRLISVEQMKRDGLPVEWAEAPPVPLPDEK